MVAIGKTVGIKASIILKNMGEGIDIIASSRRARVSGRASEA